MTSSYRILPYLVALAFPGCLFALKYAPRVALNPIVAMAGYLVLFAMQCVTVAWLAFQIRKPSHVKSILVVGLAVYVAAALTVYLRIDPIVFQVDRWSALHGFLDALSHGRYPYQATSHLGNPISGFPGLFLLALPFYWLGDVGYAQFAALIGFALLVVLKFADPRTSVFLLGLLVGLPVFLFEVFCRSELFANMVAVAWLIHLGLTCDRSGRWRWPLLGAGWGLLLSTRGVVVVALLVSVFPLLRGRGWRSARAFAIALVVTFAATFAPFYLWRSDLFWTHNPFGAQADYISTWGLALLVSASCVLGYSHRDDPHPFLHTGLLLYATVLGSWILKSARIGWVPTLSGSGFDISYFALPLPFLLIALGERLPSPSPDGGNGGA